MSTSARAPRRSRGLFGAHRSREESDPPPELLGSAGSEHGFVFARRLSGERALPAQRSRVFISPERLCRHLLVCGATGAGKTETLMRLAWVLARGSDAQVIYLDGKGDRQGAERFCSLMAEAGRDPVLFPDRPLDGWRGDAQQIASRLIEVVDYTSEGPAAYYRDIARNVIALVCSHPQGPPRSARQALSRMSLSSLLGAHPHAGALAAMKPEQVAQVRMRYEAFFAQCHGTLDGDWSFDDRDCAYLLLDSLALREEAASLARFLFEEITQHFTRRKERERLLVLIVDEFSALARRAGMAERLEQARAFRTAIVLAPQVVAGMGGEEESRRIMGSVETVICHRTNTPEELICLAGSREVMELSSAFDREGATGAGAGRLQHQFKVDPNRVRALPTGQAYVIARGRAMRVAVLRAPEVAAHAKARGGSRNERDLCAPTGEIAGGSSGQSARQGSGETVCSRRPRELPF